MKGRSLVVLGLLVLIVGAVLIFTHRIFNPSGVVKVGGILFILAGIFDMLVYLSDRSKASGSKRLFSDVFSWVTCVGAVALGVCMLFFRTTFEALIPYMFGVMVAFASIYQFFLIIYACRPAKLPGWLYIIATALAGAAIYIFTLRAQALSDPVVILTTGISLAVFGLTCVVEGLIVGRQNHVAKAAALKTLPETPTESHAETPAETPESEEKSESGSEK